MRLIAETIKSVPPIKGRPWEERVVLGVWAVSIPKKHTNLSTDESRPNT
jgi:hypothetical protein